MEISGIPLHPLVVHLVVVFSPLAALTGLAYALVPRWRWLLRWPLLVITAIAVVGAVLAAASGQSLLDSRPDLGQLDTVRTHRNAGRLLRLMMLGYTVVVALASWRLGGPSALTSGRGARLQHGGGLDRAVAALLVVGAVAVLVAVVLAGDSGARAVWG
jgi:uncharacterized membrane protein